MRTASVPPARDEAVGGYGDNRFGSSHVAGINAVMVDGSVRLINFNITQPTFAALGTRAGYDLPGPDF